MTFGPCPYCNGKIVLHQSSAAFYRGRNYGPVWACNGCNAYVGCHPGTTKPLGRVADAELRLAKNRAHRFFDPLWKRKMEREGCNRHKARGAAYKWLAGQLGIDPKDCHIGMFDIDTCNRVVEICKPYARKTRNG